MYVINTLNIKLKVVINQASEAAQNMVSMKADNYVDDEEFMMQQKMLHYLQKSTTTLY